MIDPTDETAADRATVERYRAELLAEAELARGDLDEIEDHLRSLAAELRERGVPRAEAIALACKRLGEPCEVAREHARVRSPFGARLPRARAWSAAILLAAPLVGWWHVGLRATAFSAAGIDLALWIVLLIALAARRTWARAVVLGSHVPTVISLGVYAVIDHEPSVIAWFAAAAGGLAFLVPWRRGELRSAGLALALLGPSYAAAYASVMTYMTAPIGVVLANPLGTLAFAMVLLAAGGIVLRARWAGIAAAIAAYALAATAREALPMTFRFPHASLTEALYVGQFALGCATAAIAAVLAWRGASSRLGTFRYLRA